MSCCQRDRREEQKALTGAIICSDLLLADRWNISINTHNTHCSLCVCQALSVVTVMLSATVCCHCRSCLASFSSEGCWTSIFQDEQKFRQSFCYYFYDWFFHETENVPLNKCSILCLCYMYKIWSMKESFKELITHPHFFSWNIRCSMIFLKKKLKDVGIAPYHCILVVCRKVYYIILYPPAARR